MGTAATHEGTTTPDVSFQTDEMNRLRNNGCELCLAVFTVFKRKHQCFLCAKYFCSNCSLRNEGPLCKGDRCCLRCHVVNDERIDPSRLMLLKIKDLRRFLVTNKVSLETTHSKVELVQMVLCYLEGISTSGQSMDHETTPHVVPERSSGQGLDSATAAVSSEGDSSGNNQEQEDEQSSTAQHSESSSASSESSNINPYASIKCNNAERISISEKTSGDSTHHHYESINEVKLERKSVDYSKRRISLSDITNEDDIDSLPIRRLKELLVTNFVDYKGCVEKWELVERVRRLYLSYKKSSNKGNIEKDDAYQSELCKICMDSPISCVLLECGHMVTCTKCGKRLAECPICRQYVVRAVHIFRS